MKPNHVYIIQPYGYEPPKESIGVEEYIHTEKGMWSQRIYGMEYCAAQAGHSEYLLVCDDDVEFEPDFVQRLMEMSQEHKAEIMIPIRDVRASRKARIMGLLTGGRTENKTSPYKITIRRNGRFSVNNNLPNNVNPTQSGPFQCFLMRTDAISKLDLREELWLDETRYAWPDDQVFFYKAYLRGLRVFSCKNPEFKHLDGRSGVTSAERRVDSCYASARNLCIFWNRFIKPQQKSATSRVGAYLSYYYHVQIWNLLYMANGIRNRNNACWKAYRRGLADGRKQNR